MKFIDENKGFTLHEILIVVSIIGILAVVAVPSYQSLMQKNSRSDATTGLMTIQLKQEQWRAVHSQYASLKQLKLPDTINERYQFNIELQKSQDNYLATAIPMAKQQGDPCGSFAIDKFGAVYDNYAGEQCWQQ